MTPSDDEGHSQAGEPRGDGGPDEAAHYLRNVIAELSQMAHRHRHDMLAYLLDMALLEANDLIERSGKRASQKP